jgi:hypothetical protein
MTNYKEKIFNIETMEETLRNYSADEIAEIEAAVAQVEADKIAAESEAAVKEAARQALLDKLGITADEAKLLLGGI